MQLRILKPFFWLAILVSIVSIACNFSTAATPSPEPPTQAPAAAPTNTSLPPTDAPTQAPTAVPTEESKSGAVSTLSDAKQAIIQIEAQGTFIDPEVGLVLNSAGRGSGFIIDPSGLAVTNNHVVTGAALIKVRIAGEDEVRNARLVAVSECSDLAVIDIDGDGFAYLDWNSDPIDVGQEIYVAGFPLGDPEYTLTKGVISKARADGETSWASVDSAIEYDANALPGNSGGPVLDPNAGVVGIHYAGNRTTRQSFGISRDIARDVIEELKTGNNLESLGVNGQAVANEDGSVTGIWVSSVQSGSPADQSGVQAGDILYQMENLILATDGTMSDYCDILRSHDPSDTLSLTIIRWATGELLEGQINGRELAVTGTFGSSNSGGGETTQSGNYYDFEASASGDIAFRSEFDGGLEEWDFFLTNGNDSGYSVVTQNSTLRLEIDRNNTWVYFVNNQIEMADVRIDTSVENLGRNNNNVSLICRYNDRGWYEFNIANNGIYSILRYNSSSEQYTALFSGGSRAIRTGLDTNEYVAVCSGEDLTLYINGVETRTVSDRQFDTGLAGLSVSSFDVTPIISEIDYVTFSIP